MIFLGIDLGASALKLTAVQQDGKVLASARQPIETLHPQAGFSEQNPSDWLDALQKALVQLWETSPLSPEDIAAISVTAGTHIAVLCDAAYAPLRPAILWSDQRAHQEVAELARHENAIITASLHRPNPTWTLAHLRWLWIHEQEILTATRHLFPAKDWVRHQLTDDIFTDLGDAIGTQLYDVAQENWSSPLCALAGITPDILPPIVSPSHMAGVVTAKASTRFTLKAGTPVYVGSIDTSTEMLGVGAGGTADAKGKGSATLKLASAGVVSVNCDAPQACPPISCYPHCDSKAGWYFASGMNACTPALDWFRKVQFEDMPPEKMMTLAEQSAPGAGGVLFHPYLNGERAPHWNSHLHPRLTGLNDTTTQADLARAAFEGIAYALYDVRMDLQQHTQTEISALTLLGGGALNRNWAQIICDVQNLPVQIPRYTDAAYGAALLAGLAHGAYPNLEVMTKMIEIKEELRPNAANHQMYRERFGVYRSIAADMLEEIQADIQTDKD